MVARPTRISALIEADPKQALRALAPKLTRAARKKDPAAAEAIIAALARHGDTLPAGWRKLLVELADEPPFALTAAVGLAQVKPHRSLVPPMIRRIEARLEASEADDRGRSSDDEIGLAVLAKCADRRAAPVLARLLAAPKVAHWDLMLEACTRTGAPELIPAVRRWLTAAKKKGVSPRWDGFAEGKRAIEALKKR